MPFAILRLCKAAWCQGSAKRERGGAAFSIFQQSLAPSESSSSSTAAHIHVFSGSEENHNQCCNQHLLNFNNDHPYERSQMLLMIKSIENIDEDDAEGV